MKARWAARAHKAAGAAVVEKQKLLPLILIGLLAALAQAQTVPDNELQVNLNSYFDSFNVQVVYPSISLTKKLTETSSITTRYLVDLVTAASIRSSVHADNAIVSTTPIGDDDDDRRGRTRVDGVTSASGRGGSESIGYQPDDVRHELGLGVTQLFAGGVAAVNALYSKESDYRSGTIAGTYTRSFFNNNTTVQLGSVRSWDASFPKIFLWTKYKDEANYSINLSQIWTKALISQTVYSYIKSSGLLADPYEVVTIVQGNQTSRLEPVHPSQRLRQALGLRLNYKLNQSSALHVGTRYYWDDWQVRSLTSSLGWDKHLNDISTIHFGFRNYLQTRAFFFKPVYAQPETYMSVDSKLDRGYSNEAEFRLTLQGHDRYDMPQLLMNDKIEYNFYAALYHRHTATPNWYSQKKDLLSMILSFGVVYHF